MRLRKTVLMFVLSTASLAVAQAAVVADPAMAESTAETAAEAAIEAEQAAEAAVEAAVEAEQAAEVAVEAAAGAAAAPADAGSESLEEDIRRHRESFDRRIIQRELQRREAEQRQQAREERNRERLETLLKEREARIAEVEKKHEEMRNQARERHDFLVDNKELLVKGKCMMHGYWKHEQATREVIDRQGWLHTGDQAEIVDGRIYITGRLKDIIVLSTGEKVPPCEIEQSILQDPVFENVLVVGENRPYLSALVIPNYELAAKLKNGYDTLDAELLDHIKIKMRNFPGYARIHKIGICEDSWTIENGMLTPTLKPRRQFILERYKHKIEEMYSGH